MAKTPNGLGQYSGKVGGVVYAVQNGQQIVRSYQPVVSNPKSVAQRLQRAKANLVGQISKIVPYQILVSLGSSKRERRSRFLRLSMLNSTSVVSSSDPSRINAKLDLRNFKFSEGAVIPTMTISSLTAARNLISVSMQRIGGINDDKFLSSGCIVVVTMLTESGFYESIHYRFVSASEFTESGFAFQFSHINEEGYTAAAYIAPFETLDGSTLRARAEELFGEGADFAAAMSYNPSALPVVYGESEYVRQATYTPA